MLIQMSHEQDHDTLHFHSEPCNSKTAQLHSIIIYTVFRYVHKYVHRVCVKVKIFYQKSSSSQKNYVCCIALVTKHQACN